MLIYLKNILLNRIQIATKNMEHLDIANNSNTNDNVVDISDVDVNLDTLEIFPIDMYESDMYNQQIEKNQNNVIDIINIVDQCTVSLKTRNIIQKNISFCKRIATNLATNSATNSTSNSKIVFGRDYEKQNKAIYCPDQNNLVIDLDETIVHRVSITNENISLLSSKDPNFLMSYTEKNNTTTYVILMRPHLKNFLKAINKCYNIFIYTHGTNDHAYRIISQLKLKFGFDYFVDYITRQYSTDNNKIKNKNILNFVELYPNVNLTNTIIIDDKSEVWDDNNQNNLIKITEWCGNNFAYGEDKELENMKKSLIEMNKYANENNMTLLETLNYAKQQNSHV